MRPIHAVFAVLALCLSGCQHYSISLGLGYRGATIAFNIDPKPRKEPVVEPEPALPQK